MSSASAPRWGQQSDVCYRHPDRQSFVQCQRCGRTICGECQTAAPVGFICPECMREARQSTPRAARPYAGGGVIGRVRGTLRRSDNPVTLVLIAVTALVYIAQQVSGGAVTSLLLYAPAYSGAGGYGFTDFQPWRMLTVLFVHASIWHILFNMYTLWIFGKMLEPMLGRGRYLALYFLAGFAGSLAVEFTSAPGSATVGASGAIFGFFGALIVIQHKLGGPTMQLYVLLGINLAFALFPGSNIAWQAHVGGAIGGAIVGLIVMSTRHRSKRPVQIGLLGLFAAVLIVASLLPLVA